MRIGDDSHHDGQRRANWRNHIAHPVDEVQHGSFGLSSGLSLNSLTGGRLLPEVLGVRSQWHELKRDDYKETGKSQTLPPMACGMGDWVTASSFWRSRFRSLMVSAGLLMRSFIRLREVHLGFQADHVLSARLPLPIERYKTAAQIAGFYQPLLQRLKNLPGVVAATETSTLPPYGGIPSEIEIPGKTHAEKWEAIFQLCSEGYFPVLRLQFLQGGPFNEAEVTGARKVAVVHQTFVNKYLHAENPIGREVRINQLADFEDKVSEPLFEIVGVVADAKNRGLQDPPEPEMIPYTVTGSAFRGILVHTANRKMPSKPCSGSRRQSVLASAKKPYFVVICRNN